MALVDTINEIAKLVGEATSAFGIGSKETLKLLEDKANGLQSGVQKFQEQSFSYGQNVREYLRVRVVVDSLVDKAEVLPELLQNEGTGGLDTARDVLEHFSDQFERELEDTIPLDVGPGDAGRLETFLDGIEDELKTAQTNLNPPNSNVEGARQAVERIDGHLNDVYRLIDQYFSDVAKDLQAAA